MSGQGFEFDLLRERRQTLGQPEPQDFRPRSPLLLGSAIGLALLATSLLVGGGFAWLNSATAWQVDQLAPAQAEYDGLQRRIQQARQQRQAQEKTTRSLAAALVAVRSGSALLEDLRRRTPEGVQYVKVREEGPLLRIEGRSSDPQAFARINALQLELQRSPLYEPNGVTLLKASREEPQDRSKATGMEPVAFELSAAFVPRGGRGELAMLRQLGADGMAQRFLLLERQGVKP